MERKINVLVVDDSAYNRKALTEMLGTSPRVAVVGTATDGGEALKKVAELKPDIITLDLEMPRMDGFTFLRLMMSNFPTPTIVISSRDEDISVFRALELGAVDFISKPTHQISTELMRIREELLEKVAMAGCVNMGVIKTAKEEEAGAVSAARGVAKAGGKSNFSLVVIGASTGGPPALQTLFSMLPAELPAAVAVSQHMPPGFTKSFSERLNKFSALHVSEATDDTLLRPGAALITPGGFHMGFRTSPGGIRCSLTPGNNDKYIPSVDKMFVSASEHFGAKTLAVVMTGMGYDGKAGIEPIKTGGGTTIAQSENSSVIFGMPREAIETGMIDSVLSLENIAAEIINVCNTRLESQQG